MKAIDLYSGIGGWSAGLACAGVEVVAAYEIWPPAVRTYNTNLGTSHGTADVRRIDLSALPEGVSLVVGSPPCTEFSFSNRGGGGDLAEGLKDVVRFFEVVRHIQPVYWLMENVPRIAAMVREGLQTEGHALYAFRDLAPEVRIVDLSDFGLPQSRARCLIGVFPFERLISYAAHRARPTLGGVIEALSSDDVVRDPVWDIELPRTRVTEMEPETPLAGEQLRMNREAKRFHPVYNDMPFPDALDRPSRTVTATCTRVSRESIVVADESSGFVRRLTVRERASLQGFPITYQFYGNSHSQKVKMIGNAFPPFFAYLVGAAAQGWKSVPSTGTGIAGSQMTVPVELPDVTPPHSIGTTYPSRRRFRAALPGLRFKSGVRFELSNHFEGEQVSWAVSFYFGPSKAVRTIALNAALSRALENHAVTAGVLSKCRRQLEPIGVLAAASTGVAMQDAWRRCIDGVGPYQIVDLLGQAAIAMTSIFAASPVDQVKRTVISLCTAPDGSIGSAEKLRQNAPAVLAGLLLGSWFNGLRWAEQPQGGAEKALVSTG